MLCLVLPPAAAGTPGEERFFADCPRRGRIRLHDERRPWDLHAVLYTTLGLSELEVFRVADWLIDLPLPGRPLRPFQRTARAARAGFSRLPRWTPFVRAGEFVDALQLAELSFGDAAATYSAAMGDVTGPGSGLAVRAHKLVDWIQRVTGDVNRLSGAAVGRPGGLITWSAPERAVDGAQRLLIRTLHQAAVLATRALDESLTGLEVAGEGLVNLGRRRPHHQQTVFLRLPVDVYRAHELWILERRARLVVGRAERFARSTHAALAHRRFPLAPADWEGLEPPAGTAEVIVMTTVRVIARAPNAVRSYVVPAAWVLDPPTRTGGGIDAPED